MLYIKNIIKKLDKLISRYMFIYGIIFLRFSIGLIFVWFGFLKPFGISPAQELVTNTVYWFDDKVSFVKFLGWWEVAIGITMCIKPLIRISIFSSSPSILDQEIFLLFYLGLNIIGLIEIIISM